MSTVELIEKGEENSKWLGENYKRLTKKYDNAWIAVLDKRVIDSDKELRSLISRLRKKLAERYPEAAIEYMTKKPINIVLVAHKCA